MNQKDFTDKLVSYGTTAYRDNTGKSILDTNQYIIFGVRGYTVQNGVLVKNNDKINLYNDSLFLFRNTDQPEYHSYQCTMDPGMTWLRKAMNPLGTARLKEGLYKYKTGIHRGHPALNQASQVTVRRYKEHANNAPWVSWEEEKPSLFQTGWFGIDIHAKSTTSEEVNAASAGCTVIDSIWGGAIWKDFFGLIQSVKNTQNHYYYIVLDSNTADSLVS
ncbi:hypothetical protein [Leptospira ilyithenensis]|uniref:Uncharacterized protein n=1 Tax=Leptospira ilyithenensis TaxID=2484901 RepID=A0A4R9LS52_9LEPT|nr:hypothetical protein [Leptospira ilyithenensis]TGN14061.1 hypothetical protein EHS11_02790 [Leptospira ilyithenensis]